MGDAQATAALLGVEGLSVLPASVHAAHEVAYGLVQTSEGRRLAVLGPADAELLSELEGEAHDHGDDRLLLCPLSAPNAALLRSRLPWLRPRPLGLRTSAGLGDRLGLATPGHVRAVRAAGGDLAPIFAQQSIREMDRTGRNPQQVMDDAMWGVLAEGWQGAFGADADHLKTPHDVQVCVSAGYTFFTFDPGEHVDSVEERDSQSLREAFHALPWERLADSPEALTKRYGGKRLEMEGHTVELDEWAVLRAAVKYGRAVAHVAELYRHLERLMAGGEFEVEVSVDETESPTTHAEHVYIASELRRLEVSWISLAPRYIGRFEKGVDYIGDLAAFEADLAVHATIARHLGPYKLSLHSGSDKFSIYEAAARQTRGLVHLKTAGTSYLEALRTVAALDPGLFRAIYEFALGRYEVDRASYHVSASVHRAPSPQSVSDEALPALLEQFDAREILHVTFGSVLRAQREDGRPRFYEELMAILRGHPEAYAENLEAHFLRHLRPFASAR